MLHQVKYNSILKKTNKSKSQVYIFYFKITIRIHNTLAQIQISVFFIEISGFNVAKISKFSKKSEHFQNLRDFREGFIFKVVSF